MEENILPMIPGNKIEVFEMEGKMHFKLKGEEPPVLRNLVIENKNLRIRMLDSDVEFTFIAGLPGVIVRHDKTGGKQVRISDVLAPGVSFEVLPFSKVTVEGPDTFIGL